MENMKYQIYGETEDKQKKKSYWDMAIGLQMVDDLQPTEYLVELAQLNVNGNLSYSQVEELLYSHYENETEEDKKKRFKEGDLVATRIASILDSPGYPLKPPSLMAIHKKLFHDIYDYAGKFRTVNIYKSEPVLNGRSVNYTNYDALADTLEYDFSKEKAKSYAGLTMEQIIKRISGFTSAIWQAHPFMDADVIIRTKLEKPSKIKGFALILSLFLYPKGEVVSLHVYVLVYKFYICYWPIIC